MRTRRDALAAGAHACVAALALGTLPASLPAEPASQRFMLIGLTGPQDPARASLLLVWASALAAAGHTVRVTLAGDATLLLSRQLADTLLAPGLPPVKHLLGQVLDRGVPFFLCRACAVARGLAETDIEGRNAQFTNAEVMAADMAWAAKILVI
jgi:predicted peroxiredoxin